MTRRPSSSGDALDPAAVRRLHRDACVFLGYVNPAMRYAAAGIDAGWFAEDDPRVQANLHRLRAGGVDVVALSVGVPTVARGDPIGAYANGTKEPAYEPICPGPESVRWILRGLDAIERVTAAHADRVGIARTIAEADALNAGGKLAVLLHLTGAWIGDDPAVLRTYARLGVRAIHLCVEGLPSVGDASDEARVHGGLSPLGREVVREMNRLGLVIDVSHASDESARQAFELSGFPIISSHTGCRAIVDIRRNLPDDLIVAIARRGGVIGMHFASAMMDPKLAPRVYGNRAYFEATRRKHAELRARHADPYEFFAAINTFEVADEIARDAGLTDAAEASTAEPSEIDALIDHIDRVTDLAGIDHVGIGADYDLGGTFRGLEHAGLLENLTAALLRRRYSEEDVKKVWGGNFRRVYADVYARSRGI